MSHCPRKQVDLIPFSASASSTFRSCSSSATVTATSSRGLHVVPCQRAVANMRQLKLDTSYIHIATFYVNSVYVSDSKVRGSYY